MSSDAITKARVLLEAERDRLKAELAQIEATIASMGRPSRSIDHAGLIITAPPQRVLPIADFLDEERVTGVEAALEGMKELRKFTRDTLTQWMNAKYPSIDAKRRTAERPIADAIKRGEVKKIMPNIGNKKPAVYQWVG